MSKKDVDDQQAWFRRELANRVDLSIYDEQETADRYIWTLQPAVIQQELFPFLKKQIRLADEAESEEVSHLWPELSTLGSVDALKKWCETADQWQFNWLGNDYTTVGNNRNYVDITVTAFTFLNAGKALFEETGSLLDYLERMIALANPEFQLAKAAHITLY